MRSDQRTVFALAFTKLAGLDVTEAVLTEYCDALLRSELKIRKELREQLVQLVTNHMRFCQPSCDRFTTSIRSSGDYRDTAGETRAQCGRCKQELPRVSIWLRPLTLFVEDTNTRTKGGFLVVASRSDPQSRACSGWTSMIRRAIHSGDRSSAFQLSRIRAKTGSSVVSSDSVPRIRVPSSA
jgi:hypothetical protein